MSGDTKGALEFLRSKVRSTFDLTNECDRHTFESLASVIFFESTIDPAAYLAGQVTLRELLDTPVAKIATSPVAAAAATTSTCTAATASGDPRTRDSSSSSPASFSSLHSRKKSQHHHQQHMDNIHNSRNALYEKLTTYFPIHMTQPRCNLIDLLPFH